MLGAPVSLRLRLIVSIALVLVLILVPGSALIYWHAVHEVETELQAAIAVAGRTVQNAVDDVEEAATPLRHLELLVADFDGDRHVQASLVGLDNRILYRSTPLTPDDPAPEWFYRLLAARAATSVIGLPPPFARYGAILLETDSRNEISEVWGDVVLTFAILAGFCGLNAVLVYCVTGRALRPLGELSVAFNGIGGGNYGLRVKESGPSELAQLCRGFNQMTAQLAEIEARKHRLEHQLAVQEEERSELARDLHDEIGPLLFAVSVDLAVVQQDEAVRGTPIVARIESIRDSMARLYKDVKAILGRLRPATLVDLGLAQAVESLVNFWRSRYPALIFEIHMPAEGFGMQIDDAVYHIILESLSNALRHGKPTRIEIEVALEQEQILIRVADNGLGFKPDARSPGFGLIGMHERVGSLGGVLSVKNTVAGNGVVVSARLPGSSAPKPASPAALDPVAQL